ncbi:type IA DNA topoisomerase [Caldinitratiruptor microaerophilus]|uniref:DNA topoisomerase n=1 Tax=Caldinitratiruptor microaerophilus TaxID=671077 RepID=A0AA35G5M7_9FIRM|nr:type IA DNA topoisomerase [Caldinitratiruptor microaerophilus]BDG59746.1 DNA topoisomerase [Caldinitratiruptor microaerophilus]
MPFKSLILTEKPSVARAIADALGDFSRRDGYLESPQYLLTWAAGHLVDLARPEDYDPRYEHWRMDDLPILPARWELRTRDGAAPHLRRIAKLARQAAEIVNACDAGREGELIFRQIYEHLRLRLPVRRLWLTSLTPQAIRQAFAVLRPGSDYDGLYASALARARGDWLVGINATRAFTLRFGSPGQGVLSVGRVQTPTLAMIVRREHEIRAFRPEPYWEVHATLSAGGRTFRARWTGPHGHRLHDADAAHALAQRICGAVSAVVIQADVRDEAQPPPQLHDLTSLQREANRRFGLTAAQALEAAQALYEARLITYPRTDSRYVTPDLAATFPGLLKAVLTVPGFDHLGRATDPSRAAHSRRVVNPTKVTDHHAILPTGERPAANLPRDQALVYDLIVRRFLAVCMPDALDRRVRLTLDAGGERLEALGVTAMEPGWRAADRPPGPGPEEEVPDADADGGSEVPELRPGQVVRVDAAESVAKQTRPPKRYTEGSLVAAMESAGQNLDDEAAREALKGRGLGTPATRAAIIERLKQAGYVRAHGKALVPTDKGERLIDLVHRAAVPLLASPQLTGEWEKRLNDVARGEEEAGRMEQAMRAFAGEIVAAVRAASPEPGAGEPHTLPSCPLCGSPVVAERFEVRCTRAGCGLRVSRRILGRALSDAELAALLRDRRTPVLEGFTGKAGKTFAAALVLRDDGSGVNFEFPPAPRGRAKDRQRRERRARPSRRRAAAG